MLKLNQLNTKTMIFGNYIYFDNLYADGEAMSKKHIFQLMGAENLNISHLVSIKEQLKSNFPFIENHSQDWLISCEGEPLIELSGKIARVTFNATQTRMDDLNKTYKKEYTIYIYLYNGDWYIL